MTKQPGVRAACPPYNYGTIKMCKLSLRGREMRAASSGRNVIVPGAGYYVLCFYFQKALKRTLSSLSPRNRLDIYLENVMDKIMQNLFQMQLQSTWQAWILTSYS